MLCLSCLCIYFKQVSSLVKCLVDKDIKVLINELISKHNAIEILKSYTDLC